VRNDDYYRHKLAAQSIVTDRGCWEWQGYLHRGNYGMTYYRGKPISAHRLAFKLMKGETPKGSQVCHSCDNKACCNPDHLWLGDAKANGRDRRDKGLHYTELKTHCPQGHAYAEHGVRQGKGNQLACRLCARVRSRLRAGWPEELARTLPVVEPGKRPVGAKFKAARNVGKRPPKTHCKYGHPFAGDNLYLAPDGKRRCRACQVRTVTATMLRWAEGKTATQRLTVEAAVAPLK
jgi:hypothetical protein